MQPDVTPIVQQNGPEEAAALRHGGPVAEVSGVGGVSVVMVSYWTGLVLSAAIEAGRRCPTAMSNASRTERACEASGT